MNDHTRRTFLRAALDLAATRYPRNPPASFRMRLLLAAAGTLLFLVSPAFGVADFSGKWVLDLRASKSPHAILKRLGASWVERQFGGSIPMEATYTQTPQVLTVDRRGFGFQKTDVIRIDNNPEIQQDALLGRYTIRTFWSENGTQLISIISFHTKDSRDGQLTVVREMADGGKTLIWSSTLNVAGESGSWTLRRVWRKRESS